MNLIILEVLLYFAGILLQAIWYARGQLTEQRFVLFQVAPLSLIVITVVLQSASPEFPFGLLAGSIGATVFIIVGYLVTRWLYKQLPPR